MEQLTSIKKNEIQNTKTNLGWGAKSAIWVSILGYALSQLVVLIPFGIFFVIGGKEKAQVFIEDNLWATFGLMALSAITMLGVVYIFLKRKRLSLNKLGFKKVIPSDFGYIILFGILYILVSAGLIVIAGLIPGFNADQKQDVGFANVQGWQMLVVFISLVIIPPMAEEIVFRGFLYRGLKNGWQKKPVILSGIFMAGLVTLFTGSYWPGLALLVVMTISVFVSKKSITIASALFVSSMFGLAHGQWNVALDTFVLSIMLIALYEKTKNLWACIFLHALKNGVAFVALFVLGGR